MWRRFRELPGPVQVASGLAVLAAYTLVLLVIVGGGDEEPKNEAKPLSRLETQVKRAVERGQPPQSDETDVAAFRSASVSEAKCDERSCKIVYTVAVPGRGRILVQQVDIVRRVFSETDVERFELRLFRGEPRGPAASPKSVEETPLGVPLFATECRRDRAPEGTDWATTEAAARAYSRACRVQSLFKGGPGGGSVGGGGQGEE